jgi:hypothetical protein
MVIAFNSALWCDGLGEPITTSLQPRGWRSCLGAVSPLVTVSQGENTEGGGSTTTFPSILAHGMWLARVRAQKQRLRRPACTQLPTEWWLTYALLPTYNPPPLIDQQHQQHPLLLLLEWSVTTRSLKKCLLMVVIHQTFSPNLGYSQ